MSRYNHHRNVQFKDILYRVLGAIGVIAILAFFLPSNSYTTYQYTLGEPWDDSPIIAKDSFLILKPESALQAERDSLHKFYEPYFGMDPNMEETQKHAFSEEFKQNLKEFMPDYYCSYVIDKLSDIYSHGILTTTDYEKLLADQTENIRIYQQNTSSIHPISTLYTEKSAYEAIIQDADSTRFEHEKLIKCGISRYITSNLTYDHDKSQQQRMDVDDMLVPYIGQVLAGQKIVDRGDIVTEDIYNVLVSMEKHQQARTRSPLEIWSMTTGKILTITIMVVLLLLYFEQFRNDFLESPKHASFVVLMYILFPIITYTMVSHSLMSVYLIPYCLLPIFIRVFMDSRTAFTTHMLMILTCAVALKQPYEFVLTQSVAGLVAVYCLRQLQQRSDLFRAVLLVTFSTLLTYLCIDLVKGSFFSTNGVDRWTYIYLCIAGALSLMAYLLLIPIERGFGFTSGVTLVELSNTNNAILRRLSEEAPGTFQHSMQVANLAAEVANKIGAKSQLVRTGALYHDIGKLENAVFFTENQNGTNPHDNLTYDKSAQIIIQHVQNGLKLAEKYRLPSIIKDFIATHHGQSMAKYFYISYKNQYPEQPIDDSQFSYPGPNPSTQEQAILMMADAVEAASRSLAEYTEESLSELVEKIIDSQVRDGYFNACPITFLDIKDAKETLKAKLKTIYHTRIQYPEMK